MHKGPPRGGSSQASRGLIAHGCAGTLWWADIAFLWAVSSSRSRAGQGVGPDSRTSHLDERHANDQETHGAATGSMWGSQEQVLGNELLEPMGSQDLHTHLTPQLESQEAPTDHEPAVLVPMAANHSLTLSPGETAPRLLPEETPPRPSDWVTGFRSNKRAGGTGRGLPRTFKDDLFSPPCLLL